MEVKLSTDSLEFIGCGSNDNIKLTANHDYNSIVSPTFTFVGSSETVIDLATRKPKEPEIKLGWIKLCITLYELYAVVAPSIQKLCRVEEEIRTLSAQDGNDQTVAGDRNSFNEARVSFGDSGSSIESNDSDIGSEDDQSLCEFLMRFDTGGDDGKLERKQKQSNNSSEFIKAVGRGDTVLCSRECNNLNETATSSEILIKKCSSRQKLKITDKCNKDNKIFKINGNQKDIITEPAPCSVVMLKPTGRSRRQKKVNNTTNNSNNSYKYPGDEKHGGGGLNIDDNHSFQFPKFKVQHQSRYRVLLNEEEANRLILRDNNSNNADNDIHNTCSANITNRNISAASSSSLNQQKAIVKKVELSSDSNFYGTSNNNNNDKAIIITAGRCVDAALEQPQQIYQSYRSTPPILQPDPVPLLYYNITTK